MPHLENRKVYLMTRRTSDTHCLQTWCSFKAPNKARVIGTTPKFASGIYAPTSLYDLMEEVYERDRRAKEGNKYDVGEVGWYEHIWPLLQRPPLLSWVNIMADGGHGKLVGRCVSYESLMHSLNLGPNGPGNFFDEKWQRDLSDAGIKSQAIRQGVLGRMRLPTTNGKYDQARAGQAYPYFMPWLSGDNGVPYAKFCYTRFVLNVFLVGRTVAGDPSTFASVTELQYDRLVKWSKGDFRKFPKPPHPPPSSIEKLPLKEQPGALTKASLEATIGAPLYPGIEMSWNAEKSETYQLDVPFTISEDQLPGDLTKYLSLPWQSDFYMCRSYW
jgi:hypothetical protein